MYIHCLPDGCGLLVDCQKEVQRCRDKKSQFMWSINHNVSNTVAHYSVHREERLLLSN